MKIISLYSGSKGNSTLISAGGTTVLIDAGQSARRLKEALNSVGYSPDNVDAIFITHEHTDHISALEVLLKKHPIPVHVAQMSAERLLSTGLTHVCSNLRVHPPVFTEKVGALTVTSFPTPHDSKCSVGYRISCSGGDVGYATDIGYVTDDILSGLMGCRSVIIEANHDVEMLKCGSYPYDLKKRILSNRGHLSNADCALLAVRLAQAGTKNILLAHLSEENNDPAVAYDEVYSALGDPNLNLAVADQYTATFFVDEKEPLC